MQETIQNRVFLCSKISYLSSFKNTTVRLSPGFVYPTIWGVCFVCQSERHTTQLTLARSAPTCLFASVCAVAVIDSVLLFSLFM